MTPPLNSASRSHQTLGNLIFLSRWLQAPLYFGLIVAQGVYVYHFLIELWHLILTTTTITETDIMLTVLGLIDVVMIANLLIMVIVGGYETFVSRLNLQNHPDQPEWLSHVNAGALKVKLATATIDVNLEGGRATQHSYVDYTWLGEMHVLVRHPISPRLGVFGHGSGQLFAVDETLAHRGTQAGGLIEAGLRVTGRAGVLEIFAGYEKRVDADPLDRVSQRWGLAGFRLLSR